MVHWVGQLPHKHDNLSFGLQNANKDEYNSTSVTPVFLWPDENLKYDSSLKPAIQQARHTQQRTRDPHLKQNGILGPTFKVVL